MIVADISVIPMVGATSVGPIVRKCVKALEARGLRVMPGPMSTSFEARTLDDILSGVKAAHEAAVAAGAKRVVTTVKIDDRRDKDQSMASKLGAIKCTGWPIYPSIILLCYNGAIILE